MESQALNLLLNLNHQQRGTTNNNQKKEILNKYSWPEN